MRDDEDDDDGHDISSPVIKTILVGVCILILIISIFSAFYTIEAGERGILLTFGKPDVDSKGEGLHFKIPFIQNVKKMDVKTQKYVVEKAYAASKDLQTVDTDVTINYIINPETVPTIYKEIGINYQDKVIQPAVLEIVKAYTAQYTAEELITKRPEVKDKIDMSLRQKLLDFNIVVQSVAITNFEFSESFNVAIEAKVTAEQNALAAKNKLAQVEYEAQQRITQAKGESEAIKIQAQAIQTQGGKDYVQLQAIQKWNGVLPQFTGGAMPFINIDSNHS